MRSNAAKNSAAHIGKYNDKNTYFETIYLSISNIPVDYICYVLLMILISTLMYCFLIRTGIISFKKKILLNMIILLSFIDNYY